MAISRTPSLKLAAKIGILIAVEIILITGSFAYLALVENNIALLGNSINIAGKNRFLSATVLLESESYTSDPSNANSVEESLKNLESNILLLKEGGKTGDIEVKPLPTDFNQEWQLVYENWVNFQTQTIRLISSNTPQDQIPTKSEQRVLAGDLIASSDLLVTRLGEYSKDTSWQLIESQIGLAALNIGVHLVMFFLIVRTLRPIKLLTKATTEVQKGNLDISVAQTSGDELQTLAESFNSMIRSLRESSHRLSMEKKKYQELYDGAPDLYRMIDRKGFVLDCNDSYVRNLGYSDKSELIGKSIFETTAEVSLDALRESFNEWKNTGRVVNKEVWLKRKDGSIFPTLISASATCVYYQNREIVASNSCIIDVTEIFKARKELEEANLKLKEADEMKTEFICVASHELRTPIQPILTYGELARDGIVSNEKAWEVVMRQARRLRQLANDILDVTRIEGGNLILNIERCSINKILQKIIDEGKPSANKDVQIILRLTADDEANIDADKSRLTQVMTNLIGNAIKFTKKGSIEISTLSVEGGQFIELLVSDTGVGIPEEILPKMFTKFATKGVGGDVDHGTGLGLFICKGLVEAHGGAIVGYNNEKGGATFKVLLPSHRCSLVV